MIGTSISNVLKVIESGVGIDTYRRELEKYIILLRVDLQFSNMFEVARDKLCKLVTNEDIFSKALTKHFEQGRISYPHKNKAGIVTKVSEPSKVIYLKRLITALTDAEKAIKQIENIDVHRNLSLTNIIGSLLLESPGIVNNLYSFIELINACPKDLEPLLKPIQAQIMPKLIFLMPSLSSIKDASDTENLFEEIGKALQHMLTYLPEKEISREETQLKIVENLYILPAYLDKLTELIKPENIALPEQSLENLPNTEKAENETLQLQAREKHRMQIEEAHVNLRSLSHSPGLYNLTSLINKLLSLSGDLLESSEPFTKESYSKAIEKLNNLRHEHIPQLINEVCLLEKSMGLSNALYSSKLTQSLDGYYSMLAGYVQPLESLLQQIPQLKRIQTTSQKKGGIAKLATSYVAGDLTVDVPPPSAENKSLTTMQDSEYIEHRIQLLNDSELEHHSQLFLLETIEQTTIDFFNKLSRVTFENDRKVQIPVAYRLSLLYQFKLIQPYIEKANHKVNMQLKEMLEVSSAERLQVIGECQLSAAQKNNLAKSLNQSIDQAKSYINGLDISQETKQTLCLALSHEYCIQEDFIEVIEKLPDSKNEVYFAWGWFEQLKANELTEKKEQQPSNTSDFWSKVAYLAESSLACFSMGLYYAQNIHQRFVNKFTYNSITHSKSSILDVIYQEITDEQFELTLTREHKNNIILQKQTTLETIQEANTRSIERYDLNQTKSTKEIAKIKQEIQLKKEEIKSEKKDKGFLSLLQSQLKALQSSLPLTNAQIKSKQHSMNAALKQKSIVTKLPIKQPVTQLSDNLSTLSKEALLNEIIKKKQKLSTLEQHKDAINSFYQTIHQIENAPTKDVKLDSDDLQNIQLKLSTFQSVLSDIAYGDMSLEEHFINVINIGSAISITELLKTQELLFNKINQQKAELETRKTALEKQYFERPIQIAEITYASDRAFDDENLLFKNIGKLKLAEKIKAFRENRVSNFLKTNLAPEIYEALDVRTIEYPITTFHKDTQIIASYKQFLNSLHYLEQGLESISELDKMGTPESFIAKTTYVTTIIRDLVVNVYSSYHYLSQEQQNPKIIALIKEALKIIGPLESIPVLTDIIQQATKSAQESLQQQAQQPKIDIVEAWQNEMHLLSQALEGAPPPVITQQDSEELKEPLAKHPIESENITSMTEDLVKAFYRVEMKLNDFNNDKKLTRAALKTRAQKKAANLLNTLEALPYSIYSIQKVINNYSQALCDISNSAHLTKERIQNQLSETSFVTISRLEQMADNLETTLGVKPGIFGEQLFVSLNDFYLAAFNSKDKHALKFEQAERSINKRIAHQEKLIKKLSENTAPKELKDSLFTPNASAFDEIKKLVGSDLSHKHHGILNRKKFLKAYAKVQPSLFIIDANFDTKLFLRELQTQEDFQIACKTITNHELALKDLVDASQGSISQQQSLCKKQIEYLQKRKRTITLEKIDDDYSHFINTKPIHNISFKIRYLSDLTALSQNRSLIDDNGLKVIMKTQKDAIDLYDTTHKMLLELDKIEDLILKELKDLTLKEIKARSLSPQNKKMDSQTSKEMLRAKVANDKIKIISQLKLKIKASVDNHSHLSPIELHAELINVMGEFQKALPTLKKYSGNALLKKVYDFINNYSPFLASVFYNADIQKEYRKCDELEAQLKGVAQSTSINKIDFLDLKKKLTFFKTPEVPSAEKENVDENKATKKVSWKPGI